MEDIHGSEQSCRQLQSTSPKGFFIQIVEEGFNITRQSGCMMGVLNRLDGLLGNLRVFERLFANDPTYSDVPNSLIQWIINYATKFPFYEELHAIWSHIPSFSAETFTSEPQPGKSCAGCFLSLVQKTTPSAGDTTTSTDPATSSDPVPSSDPATSSINATTSSSNPTTSTSDLGVNDNDIPSGSQRNPVNQDQELTDDNNFDNADFENNAFDNDPMDHDGDNANVDVDIDNDFATPINDTPRLVIVIEHHTRLKPTPFKTISCQCKREKLSHRYNLTLQQNQHQFELQQHMEDCTSTMLVHQREQEAKWTEIELQDVKTRNLSAEAENMRLKIELLNKQIQFQQMQQGLSGASGSNDALKAAFLAEETNRRRHAEDSQLYPKTRCNQAG
ncbi:hypothetical protein BJ138DRAFT_1105444 [Hygrophoropsis aurantiaca]|uniref:Uncharacterized protein n=1 Tax=Hygrophoropsis aurantiaca TaxID=72124 RepID=A0ACB7ZY57_9AGAM|nr:hypothetical protein BJ138DRAFT_1105444 [Hygrophoropsis aurantiaca]